MQLRPIPDKQLCNCMEVKEIQMHNTYLDTGTTTHLHPSYFWLSDHVSISKQQNKKTIGRLLHNQLNPREVGKLTSYYNVDVEDI
eukprot:scaffold6452_cov30-Prasinocladus_malaysianus.AAC.1